MRENWSVLLSSSRAKTADIITFRIHIHYLLVWTEKYVNDIAKRKEIKKYHINRIN